MPQHLSRYLTMIMLPMLLLMAIPIRAQEPNAPEFEPFIQNDFKILTGDVQRPNGIYWHDGFLYTACAGDSTLYRIDAETGETATYIPAVQDTHMLYVEDGPIVWVADYASGRFLRIARETGLVPIQDSLPAPWGITPSATNDTFYMTFHDTGELINMTREGGVRVMETGFDQPTGVVATEDMIFVANAGDPRRAIEWLNIGDPELPEEPQLLVSGVQDITNLVLAADGYLYFAYSLGPRGAIGRIEPTTCIESEGCANADVELVVWTTLAAPLAGLTISPDLRLFVHTRYGHEIYWLDLYPAGYEPTEEAEGGASS